ncbi:MAG: hypothetical protein ACRDYC_12925, partial [Acidimicrobiales bacterium]
MPDDLGTDIITFRDILCCMEAGLEGDLFIKRSTSVIERRRLEREAEVLRRALHPGVVELVGDCEVVDDLTAVLRTRALDGGSLEDLRPFLDEEILGVGAACATILADLHGLGISHGRIEPGHILLDVHGCPVLCGWADAAFGDEAAPSEDVAALASTLQRKLSSRAPVAAVRVLRRAAGLAGSRRAPSARDLARALSAPGLGARLPDRSGGGRVGTPSSTAEEPPSSSRPPLLSGPTPLPARRGRAKSTRRPPRLPTAGGRPTILSGR